MYACHKSANTFSNFATVGSQPSRIMQEASFGTSNKGGKILIGEHQYDYRKPKSGLPEGTPIRILPEKIDHPVVLRC